MRWNLLPGALIIAFVSFAAGVAAVPAYNALTDDPQPSCDEGRLESMGLVHNGGAVVRLCYPPTWYVDAPVTMKLADGSEFTGQMSHLRTVRQHEVRRETSPGFVHVSSTLVLGVLNVVDPDTAKQMGDPPCTIADPLHQDGDLLTCADGYPAPTNRDGPNLIESVYFITADGYRIEGRAFPPYSPTDMPNDEEYAGLAEQWPGILADMKEIARDFASRVDERRSQPGLPPTPTPAP